MKKTSVSNSNPGARGKGGKSGPDSLTVAASRSATPKSNTNPGRSAPSTGHGPSSPNATTANVNRGGATLAIKDNANAMYAPTTAPVKNSSPASGRTFPSTTPARTRRVPGQSKAKGSY